MTDVTDEEDDEDNEDDKDDEDGEDGEDGEDDENSEGGENEDKDMVIPKFIWNTSWGQKFDKPDFNMLKIQYKFDVKYLILPFMSAKYLEAVSWPCGHVATHFILCEHV